MEYHYDPLGRRLAKVGAEGVVFYGWDGDTLAFETRSTGAIHYLFEPASFTPLAQVHTAPIEGLRVPAWGAHIPYDPEADPLRAPPPEPEPPRAIFYYHTDHLGTPQLLTDAAGQQALEMEYQAWGAAREILTQAAQSAGLRNPLRFQGQYHDDESGLHYNRYRYYDPDTGRFISRDPIGLLGGMNVHAYAPNPVEWVDPLGLCSSKLNKNLGGVTGDGLQAHHLIPEEVWNSRVKFFDAIGMVGQRDESSNGILMPGSLSMATKMGRKFYHCGSHARYSKMIKSGVEKVKNDFDSGRISAVQARSEISALQKRAYRSLSARGSTSIRLD